MYKKIQIKNHEFGFAIYRNFCFFEYTKFNDRDGINMLYEWFVWGKEYFNESR